MERRVLIKKGIYRDSITLLRLSKQVEKVGGVAGAAVVMASAMRTPNTASAGPAGSRKAGASGCFHRNASSAALMSPQ